MSKASLERAVEALSAQPANAQISALIALAGELKTLAPDPSQHWTIRDVRQDIECDDTVGLYARLEGETVRLAAEVGQEVTTLTKALTALLVKHLDGERASTIRTVTSSDLAPIVPETLLRQRRNTVHYAVQRLQDVVRALESAAIVSSA
jgi:cysteine desulfuration protein SufE